MPQNIEIKARAGDWDEQIGVARKLSDREEILIQEDTFYHCPEGRLKLREQKGKEDYLIFYRRSDKKGPKRSEYFTSLSNDAKSLKKLLSKALGKTKVIKKKRIVFFAGQTRIHFDEVRGLGRFIELEVCLKKNQSQAFGVRLAKRLMKELNIKKKDLVDGAYADLL